MKTFQSLNDKSTNNIHFHNDNPFLNFYVVFILLHQLFPRLLLLFFLVKFTAFFFKHFLEVNFILETTGRFLLSVLSFLYLACWNSVECELTF